MASFAAAEIVAIALRKFKKLANSRKYQALLDECTTFLDNIHQIIPALPEGSTGNASSTPQLEQALQEAVKGAEEAPSAVQDQDAGETGAGNEGGAAAPAPTPAKKHFAEEDLAEAVNSMGESPGSSLPGAGATAASAPAAAQPASVGASTGSSTGSVPVQALPDLVPRTETALPDAVLLRIISIMRLAVETERPNIIEVALDCIQKLIAFKFMQGAVYALNLEKPGTAEQGERPAANALDPSTRTPQAQAIELMCRCDEIPDEHVELQVCKGLLTASTSSTFTIHNQALLLAVRTCYNIYLMSRNEVNQTTAKASLTQMLNVVFQRLEADDVLIEVKPIVLVDMLGLQRSSAGAGAQDMGAALAATVQAFLNNVVMVSGAGTGQSVEELRSSVAGAFSHDTVTHAPSGGASAAAPGQAAAAASEAHSAGGASTGDAGGAQEQQGQHGAGRTRLLVGPYSDKTSGITPSPSSGTLFTTSLQLGPTAPRTPEERMRTSVLEKDAYLVFITLCKLSTRTSDVNTAQDPTAVRGKVLALELIKILLENSGLKFRKTDMYISAMRSQLCESLLKNSGSSVPAVQQLCASIFLTLTSKFRTSFKNEVAMFFNKLLLEPLEPAPGAPGAAAGAAGKGASAAGPSGAAAPPAVPPTAALLQYRSTLLRVLMEICRDGQLLVDMFVNYDCDIDSSNLFERMVNALVRIAQQPPASSPPSPLLVDTGNLYHQEQFLRAEALQSLVNLVEAMLHWYRLTSGLVEVDLGMSMGDIAGTTTATAPPGEGGNGTAEVSSGGAAEGAGGASSSAHHGHQRTVSSLPGQQGLESADQSTQGPVGALTPLPGGQQDEGLNAKRAYKQRFQEGIALFNKKPKKGIEFLQQEGMVDRDPAAVALFLAKTKDLDKTMIGDYMGERDDYNIKVMHAYVDALDFTNLEFDSAIRSFLAGFRLPGEAQKIDRLMEKFAERFVRCNPASFKSADVAYVLAYSVIMLNTDLHNPQVKKKMTKEGFLKNNRGINDGHDLPEEFLTTLFDRIASNEIKMKDEGTELSLAPKLNQSNNIFATLLSMVGAIKQTSNNEPSEESIKRTLDMLHEKAKSSTAVTVTECDAVRPMMEVIWAPLLGALSVLFDEYSDPRLVRLCLQGFSASSCLTAQTGMTALRDIFINSLCSFTHLHSPATMRYKNALAFKYLLRVAETVGDHISERWVDILRCISRWELLQQIASGMPTDAVLFSAPVERGVKAVFEKARRLIREHDNDQPSQQGDSLASSGGGAGGSGGININALAMNEASIKKLHIGGSNLIRKPGGGLSLAGLGGSGNDSEHGGIPVDVINSCDTHELSSVFIHSDKLNGEAVVSFVRALCAISQDELANAKAPRVFSLAKIVEIAHYNMTRIRLVWSRIWAVLSDYFIQVGCHPNLQVAMYAVDSLRQLAMKFLERDELANYTFQNDFLRPFVVVMRQSQAVEIRELILRCLSQMVLARVNNVKSGWKSMFMVFTTAAGDKEPMIVRLAFDTIEKIVREHFGHITETETTTFTDCVNCLIAFTNNPHSLDVALNSIAFLRFCAMKLAEGAIGELGNLPEGVPAVTTHHPLRVTALDSVNSLIPGSLPGVQGEGDIGQQFDQAHPHLHGHPASPRQQRQGSGQLLGHLGDSSTPSRSSLSLSSAPSMKLQGFVSPEAAAAAAEANANLAAEAEAAAADLVKRQRRSNSSTGGSMAPGTGTGPSSALERVATMRRSFSMSPDKVANQGSGGLHHHHHHHHHRGPDLKFVDRDEHVYFWFPLLAGLSELTFDPRPEIRASALEVLFDTLKYHGGTFAESFWKRVFDSVLLPIFDHVRAEVTDTTTFTSEKRRQQEDAWLYETCTRCLQHLIDVFVQFYEETDVLLPQLLQLLFGFMDRTHQSLAAVGVAALVRLINSAAPHMDAAAWMLATNFLMSTSQEICPSAVELVTPPSSRGSQQPPQSPLAASTNVNGGHSESPTHGNSSSSRGAFQPEQSEGQQGAGTDGSSNSTGSGASAFQQAAGAPLKQQQQQASGPGRPPGAAANAGSGGGGGAGGVYSLREGVGARRLARFRTQAHVQLLLVQGCSDVYAKQYERMPAAAVDKLLQTLECIATHARGVDMDLPLRKRLAMQQAEDRVSEDRAVADPPLLRLETEASHAYLSVLLHMITCVPDTTLRDSCSVTTRIVTLCHAILSRFAVGAGGAGVLPDPEYMAEASKRLAQLQAAHKAAEERAAEEKASMGALGNVLGVSGRTAAALRTGAARIAAVSSAAQGRTPDLRSLVVGRTSAGIPVLMAAPSVEYAPFATLVGSTLRAVGAFDDDTFRSHLPSFFPLLVSLIRTDYAPAEVLRALAELFAKRVGPVIGVVGGMAAVVQAGSTVGSLSSQQQQEQQQQRPQAALSGLAAGAAVA